MGRAKRGSCPLCGEKVRARAPMCDYCGHHLDAPARARAGGGGGRRFAVMVGLVVLLVGAGVLIAKNAGLFDGKASVDGWAGAEFVNGIEPRRTPLRMIQSRLGEYHSVGTYGNNLEWVRFEPAEAHVASLTLWLDRERIVRWMRIVPTAPVKAEAMQASVRHVRDILSILPGFRFAERPVQSGEMWSGGTGYMHVVDGYVKELWLVSMGTRHDVVVRESFARARLPVHSPDPSGMGIDPRRGG